ncbi:unnamed protein product [Periconia digitata]|uniref:Secreted protein n=1 Tax=Periconia digitata TaxID=1303443 RepID=A0A9W4U4X3_9PLEO|nr:unnamed protein product [Periconia digitata]
MVVFVDLVATFLGCLSASSGLSSRALSRALLPEADLDVFLVDLTNLFCSSFEDLWFSCGCFSGVSPVLSIFREVDSLLVGVDLSSSATNLLVSGEFEYSCES